MAEMQQIILSLVTLIWNGLLITQWFVIVTAKGSE